MRYLGLDLGTKTCGIAITDITNTIVFPKETITFASEKYDELLEKLTKVINDNKITNIVIGLPINMDGSKGFAAERTMKFVELLSSLDVKVDYMDERLTSVSSQKILHEGNIKSKNFGKKVDMLSASLILESYLRKKELNEK